MDSDQDQHSVGPDLESNRLTLSKGSWKNFLKKRILKMSWLYDGQPII